MSEQETLMQKHLRTYARDGMTSKFRLDRTIEGYKAMDKKAQEAIIDEGDLLKQLKGRIPQNLSQIQTVEKRKQKNEALRDEVIGFISQGEARAEELSRNVQDHLIELSDIEITKGGFVTHTIVHDHNVKVDTATKIVNLDKKAHAEYAIATKLSQWRDTSQIKIVPRDKK